MPTTRKLPIALLFNLLASAAASGYIAFYLYPLSDAGAGFSTFETANNVTQRTCFNMTDVAQNYHTIPYNTTIHGNYYSACVFNGVRYVDGRYKFGRYYDPRAQYPEWDVEQWYCSCCNHNATASAAMQFNVYGKLDRRNNMYPWLGFSCQGYYWQNSGSANWSVKSISFHPKNMDQTACRKRDEWCHQRKHG